VCDYTCVDPGAPFIDCDAGCVREDHNCAQPQTIADASVDSVCVDDNVATPGCGDGCFDDGDYPDHAKRRCVEGGKCKVMIEDCEFGACSDMSGCKSECETDLDCTPPAHCGDNDKCEP
jgi:hypothetical protein